jgi:hypothetical protein
VSVYLLRIVVRMTATPRVRRILEFAAIVAVALAAGLVQQPPGDNQTAHLALVKALADGTPRIDRYQAETADDSFIDGHYYTAKAPGLALFTEPWYRALRAANLDVANPAAALGAPQAFLQMPRMALWQVGIFGATLPLLVLLLLVRWAAERVAPGYGGLAAVLGGLGTLLFPFGSMFFAHVLAATLVFAAFCVLLRERERRYRPLVALGAGVLAGFAVVVEFPTALLALVLGGLVLAGPRPLARGAAYAGGVVVGVLPLVAFNIWAFGSPTTLSYTNAVITPGTSGHDVVGANGSGFFGVGVPSGRAALELLFSGKGLLIVCPLLLAAAPGIVLLRRAGKDAESVVCGAVGLMFLVYNAAYFIPFGGWGPGPRFLVAVIPFLLVPVSAALAALPYATAALGVCSALVMVLANAVAPIVPEGRGIGFWLGRARVGDFTETLLTRAGWGHGWAAIAPVLLLALGALVLGAAADVRDRPDVRNLLAAAAAVGGWLILLRTTPELLRSDRLHGTTAGAVATVAIACGLALAFRLVLTRGVAGFLAAAPFALVALPGFAVHTKWSLLVSVAGLGVVAALSRRPGSRTVPA